MPRILAFDIETVPDVELGRLLYDLNDLSDSEVAEIMFNHRLQETDGKSQVLRSHAYRVVAISILWRDDDKLVLRSLGTEDDDERELLRQFFGGIDKYTPTLVSWNGKGFDMPVLHYRALRHGIVSNVYWDQGDDDRDFRYNNYLNRYHQRHMDVMQWLANHDNRSFARLDEIARLLGLPGKTLLSGADVWPAFLEGRLAEIRRYCEQDALLTYLIYLRCLLIAGRVTEEHYQRQLDQVRDMLTGLKQPPWDEFLRQWNLASGMDAPS